MNNSFNKLALSTAIAAVLSAMPLSASATNGMLGYGNGIVSQGAGGVGVANAGEGMSAADNPALAADVGAGWSIQATAFNPNRSANVGNGYVESDSSWFAIPGGHWFGRVNENTVAGFTVVAMGGMNTDYPPALFGAQTGMSLEGVIIAPTIATKVSDKVSIGAALLYGYQTLETKGAGPQGPNGPNFPMNTDDSSTGWGFEVGMAIQATPTTTIGIDYQSEIDMDVMDKHAAYLFAPASDPQLTFPAVITLGVTQKIGDNWKVSADVSDVPWSDIALLDELFGWEDQTIYKIGAEVQVNPELAIRFGYNYGASPIPDSAVGQNILAPATTESHYTIGFSRNVGARGVLHGNYAYVPENEQSQEGGPGGLPSIKMDQNYFGLGYEMKL